MPRHKRLTVPDTLVHVISRVTDNEYRIDDDARADYLARIGRVAPRANWHILAYALMSTHIHLLLYCLGVPIKQLVHPVHSGFGTWMNVRDTRRIPVFSERPQTLNFPPLFAPFLLGYLHNNPVRAGVVDAARASHWTSHRAYVGVDDAPSWLNVDLGMRLCDLEPTSEGREAFDQLVQDESRREHQIDFSRADYERDLRLLRERLNAPIDVGTPTITEWGQELPVLGIPGMGIEERWDGELATLVDAVARETGVSAGKIRSRVRTADVVRARHLALLTGATHLGLTIKDVAAAVGLTKSAGSKLLQRNDDRRVELEPLAVRLAGRLRNR